MVKDEAQGTPKTPENVPKPTHARNVNPARIWDLCADRHPTDNNDNDEDDRHKTQETTTTMKKKDEKKMCEKKTPKAAGCVNVCVLYTRVYIQHISLCA